MAHGVKLLLVHFSVLLPSYLSKYISASLLDKVPITLKGRWFSDVDWCFISLHRKRMKPMVTNTSKLSWTKTVFLITLYTSTVQINTSVKMPCVDSHTVSTCTKYSIHPLLDFLHIGIHEVSTYNSSCIYDSPW